MTNSELTAARLRSQSLLQPSFDDPGRLVAWMGAVQAQDFLGSLWGIGQRLGDVGESEVEQAIESRTIVRTWPMRGTLHFVSPADVRWMLKLLTPRVMSKAASIYKKEGLDQPTLMKSRRIVERALAGGIQVERQKMYDLLDQAGLSPVGLRGLHILGFLAQEGVICLGPRKAKQFTFTLLEEWVPAARQLSREESLFELARRFFASHGPATVKDFSWWSGLSVTEAAKATEMARAELREEKHNDEVYWMSEVLRQRSGGHEALLLPSYDEYLVGYEDRSAAWPASAKSKDSRRSIFSPTVVIRGQIVGVWRRTLARDEVIVEVTPIVRLTTSHRSGISKAVQRYARFVGRAESRLRFV